MNNKTGEIIEKYRKERNLTQVELANKLGVSKSAISKWENGNNLPDITLLEPLSEILGIDKLLLFTSENTTKEENNERIKTIKRKNRIRLSIISIIFIFSIIFTNYISYKVYKHNLTKLENNQTEVYRFYSNDEEYYVNGYIIFQDGKSTLLFNQLEYQDIKKVKQENKYKASEEIDSIEVHLYVNETLVFADMKESNNNQNDINKILNSLIKTLNNTNSLNIENDIKESSLKIIITKEGKIKIKDIKLEASNKI
jgi:transcriptional regulator with XRE-family HTH domain